MEMFLVGGIVRDKLLGVPSKDHDFVVVLDNSEMKLVRSGYVDAYSFMKRSLEDRKVEIFVETPEFLTIRGRFSKLDPEYPGLAADFVLARKDSTEGDGRRPDYVVPGDLFDDLARRDFTVNAMAMRSDGVIIDPHEGMKDLVHRELWFVGDPMTRIREDALRVMRAIRFCVTKGFTMSSTTRRAILNPVVPELLANISEERRDDELNKMLKHDTLATLDILCHEVSRELLEAVFSGRVRLMSTLKA